MTLPSRLLTAAILAALALAAPADAATEAGPVQRAAARIAADAAPAVFRAADDRFVAVDSRTDGNGAEHVRFQRTWRGLPVIGGDFVVHTRRDRVDVTTSLKTAARPSTTPKLAADDAIVEAGTRFGTRFAGTPTSRLVVFSMGRAPTLAYEVVFEGIRPDQTPTKMVYYVDANTGAVLRQWDRVQTATPGPGDSTLCAGGTAAAGTGHGLTVGTVTLSTTNCGQRFQLRDLTRGGGYTTNMLNRQTGDGAVFFDGDNAWGTGQFSNLATVGAEAHYGVSATWDYFKQKHGRNGIADDGRGAISRVHYGRNYANAFWRDDCFCMTFGDGDGGVEVNPLTVLDIAAHEMSHGVTSRTANLVYDSESGGLNEATSDIFGVLVEFHAQNPVDRGDWLLGEQVYAQNDGTLAVRYMFKPSLDGASADCWDADVADLDVHYSSGVANHFFYLLSQGAVVPRGFRAGSEADLRPADLVCNGDVALPGINRNKAGKIWYTALTTYMLPDTDYQGARAATLQAAEDLYGAGSDEVLAVDRAWAAVNVVAPEI